jgi:predicted thioesterase
MSQIGCIFAKKTKGTKMVESGLRFTCSRVVEEQHLAVNMGSGDLRVLATPSMVALMEEAAMCAVASHLPEGSTTVGGHISVSHLKPTAYGGTVSATAELKAVEGRKLTFAVVAHEGDEVIGQGEHVRFVVDGERFMAKLG